MIEKMCNVHIYQSQIVKLYVILEFGATGCGNFYDTIK